MKAIALYLGAFLLLALVCVCALLSAHTDGERTVLGTDSVLLCLAFVIAGALSLLRSERPSMWLGMIVAPLLLGLSLLAAAGWSDPALAAALLACWFFVGVTFIFGVTELLFRPRLEVLIILAGGFFLAAAFFAAVLGHEYLLGLHSSF